MLSSVLSELLITHNVDSELQCDSKGMHLAFFDYKKGEYLFSVSGENEHELFTQIIVRLSYMLGVE